MAAPAECSPQAAPPVVAMEAKHQSCFEVRDIPFPYDANTIVPQAARMLDKLAAYMKAYPGVSAVIEGHSDERGTKKYNLALSARRAAAAKRYLVKAGVNGARIKMVSYGAQRPLDPAHNEAAWAKNRRAHFELSGH